MTTKKITARESHGQRHAERLQRCAELGQVVPIDKVRSRAHYEAIVAQLQQEAIANVHA